MLSLQAQIGSSSSGLFLAPLSTKSSSSSSSSSGSLRLGLSSSRSIKQGIIRASATYMDSVAMGSRVSSSQQTLYDVLGISRQSELKDIKTAYRHLARVSHPDVVPMEHKEESAKDFLRIHAAYTTLSDPESRARYDLQLSLQSLQSPRYSAKQQGFSGFGSDSYAFTSGNYARATASSPGAASSQWKGRSWETDQCW